MTGAAPDPRPPAPGFWRVLTDAVREAPPKARRSLRWIVIGELLALSLALLDLLTGSRGFEPYRLLAMACGLSGLTLLGVTLVLHQASQRGAASCKGTSLFRLQTEIPHRALVALPVLAGFASVLLALAIGLAASVMRALSGFLLTVAVFSGYLILALRTVAHMTRFLFEHAERQSRAAADAQAEAAEAQLRALQAQMNPHFLFNALNTVASLVRTNPAAAESTVEHLAGVLRRTLDRSRRTTGTLREEMDFVKSYLAVEQERWGDRLRVEWAVAPDTLALRVPPMTLQPLVENALRHGLGARLEGGAVRVEATRANGTLRLAVSDDGAGFARGHAEGTGLGNLRSRLTNLFGERGTLRVETPSRGARVVVEMPADTGAVER